MAKDVLRQSQVVGLFGPGAMLDLPERSVIVSSVDEWNMRGPNAFRTIDEPRLSEMLRERLTEDGRWPEGRALNLRTPPIGSNDPRLPSPQIQVRAFPTWFTCDDPTPQDARRRRMVRWTELDPARRMHWQGDDGKKQQATPIRFVCGCKNGHLQDIDWKQVLHGAAPCQEPMWLEETGTSSEARDARVRCGCSKSITLDELFIKGRLGTCRGNRPWIGDREDGCTELLRLLTRSATNTYFPQVATIISLPVAEDELTRRVAAVMGFMTAATEPSIIAILRTANPQIAENLRGYSDADVFARLQQLREGAIAAASKDPRVAEFELLASGRKLIGENSRDARLHAETLGRDAWDPERDDICAGIASLVAVHRLREVSCLYGFTRFEPAPLVDDDLEDIGLAVEGAPLGVQNDWLPAIERFGEGLFLRFDPEALASWLGRDATRQRLAVLQQGAAHWVAETKRNIGTRHGGPYLLAHSLAHVLMTEIALDCGYPASALSERIYALPSAVPDEPARVGLLIYTATAGTQGSLGGLVEVAGRLTQVLRSALTKLLVCSGDPVCADHDPTRRIDDRALHGAACHGCLLIAETSCEARNLHLDRALLVETMATEGAGFFRP
jgi:hypothetical protein